MSFNVLSRYMIELIMGPPGSGKSYYAALQVSRYVNRGRKVFTNLPLTIEYVEEHNDLIVYLPELDKKSFIGEVSKSIYDGYVFILDECHQFFDKTATVETERFIAEHRHRVMEVASLESGLVTTSTVKLSSDILLITQSVSSLPLYVKNRIENTYVLSKLSNLGMSGRYKIKHYSGYNIRSNAGLLNQEASRYKPEIFKIYNSYAVRGIQNTALNNKDVVIERFGAYSFNIFTSWFMIVVYVILGLGLYSSYMGVNSNVLNKYKVPVKTAEASIVPSSSPIPKSSPVSDSKPVQPSNVDPVDSLEYYGDLKIVGYMESFDKRMSVYLNHRASGDTLYTYKVSKYFKCYFEPTFFCMIWVGNRFQKIEQFYVAKVQPKKPTVGEATGLAGMPGIK